MNASKERTRHLADSFLPSSLQSLKHAARDARRDEQGDAAAAAERHGRHGAARGAQQHHQHARDVVQDSRWEWQWRTYPRANVVYIRLEAVKIVKDPKDNFQGLVGYSAQYNAILIAFRGSMDIMNWIDNITFIKKRAYAEYPTVKVHQGFFWVYRSVADQLIPQVKKLQEAHPDASVMVTGHSLGAAVAAICTFELQFLEKVNVDALYTFGEPRVGNSAFSGLLHNTSIDVFRITHSRDVVPHLPPTWVGFEHMTREVMCGCIVLRWIPESGLC
ncbi:Lipase, partial [Globisporangium splendens]